MGNPAKNQASSRASSRRRENKSSVPLSLFVPEEMRVGVNIRSCLSWN